jgi:hypothetical protein
MEVGGVGFVSDNREDFVLAVSAQLLDEFELNKERLIRLKIRKK